MKKGNLVSILLGVTALLLVAGAIGYREYQKRQPIKIAEGISLNITLEEHMKTSNKKRYYHGLFATRVEDVILNRVLVDSTKEFTGATFSIYFGKWPKGVSNHINCILPPEVDSKTKRIRKQQLLVGIAGGILYIPSEPFPDWFDTNKDRSFLNVASIPYLDGLLLDLKNKYGEPNKSYEVNYLPKMAQLSGDSVKYYTSSTLPIFSYLTSLDESSGMMYEWKQESFTVKYFSGFRDFPDLENKPRIQFHKELYRLSFLLDPQADKENPTGYELGYYPFIQFEMKSSN